MAYVAKKSNKSHFLASVTLVFITLATAINRCQPTTIVRDYQMDNNF